MSTPEERPRPYPPGYSAAHGDFSLVPASYVFLLRGDDVLLQRRSNTGYYDGFWAAGAAGHVDPGESALTAAAREAAEELGVQIAAADLEPLTTMHRTGATGDSVDERVDFFFACRRWSGDPIRNELDKASDLGWFALAGLPDPVVPHELFVLERLRAGDLAAIMAYGF